MASTRPRIGVPANRSMAELAAGLFEEAENLVRLEIELAKQEVKELAKSNAIGAGLLAGAGFFLGLALLVALPVFLIVALPWHWQLALAWLVLYLLLAGVLGLVGRSKLQLHPPRKTISSLKETKEWAVRQIRSPAK